MYVSLLIISNNAPVCTDHSVIAIFIPQKVLNNIMAETVAHILSGRIAICRNGVVRHHCRSPGSFAGKFESPVSEWHKVLSEIVARKDSIFSYSEMGVPAAFSSSSARPVLDHTIYRFFTPAILASRSVLKTFAIFPYNVLTQIRIFAESSIKPSPTRF